MIGAIYVYIGQLYDTVSGNLMKTVDEISRHDVQTIEGSLDNSYARLDSVAKRMRVYDVHTMEQAQEQMNLEAASSALFNAIYLMDDEGNLYSSSYVRLTAAEHAYDELILDGRDHFAMLYDDANGRLETTKESLIYGIRINNLTIEGRTFIAMLARSDLSIISDQLLIESFDGQGISSVVNSYGYYIVSASPATDLSGRDNFYDLLESGTIADGVTIDDVRQSIANGESLVISCTTGSGERLVMSFAPVEGTTWSFIMTVPSSVFDQRFAPFIIMTVVMLLIVAVVLVTMMAVLYRFMKRSISANAEAAARAEFLSNMSHEIRTPLNGIIGLNHLMERHLDDRQAMEGYVKKLDKAAHYLLSLVNDILDVSKLQAGKVELNIAPFNLALSIENVCDMQQETMDERGIHFTAHTEQLAYPYLLGDEVRLSQVLMNILSNAVKFTPEGGMIDLRVSQQPTSSGRHVSTTISIADTGCGMSQDFQNHIFDMFTQERTSSTESQKGTGLGMAISHLLIAQMGGIIELESELGRGTCFTIIVAMPLDPTHLDEMPLEEGKTPSKTGQLEGEDAHTKMLSNHHDEVQPMRVLVAEDNELNADIISSILGEEGFDVTVVSNGREAVNAFAQSDIGEFEAILMDAQMPEMDGYEAACAIRKLNRIDADIVKIFACTASTFIEDRTRAMESGMDDFLPKPLNVSMMLEKLNALRK